jgi:hypothetical protein
VWTMNRCVVVRFRFNTGILPMDVSSVRDLSLGMSIHTPSRVKAENDIGFHSE